MYKIAILGYGIVGGGISRILNDGKSKIKAYTGKDAALAYILDLKDFPDDPFGNLVVKDIDIILNDKDVKVICETMGGVKAAYDFTKRALSRGISVCSSNKELVSEHGAEFIKLAKENNCSYLFEAAVGGGIPILRPFSTSLMHEKISRVSGIINGTTNFMLTRMNKLGDSFDGSLKAAQEKGYAELDPSADVDGIDTCRKTAILASLASGKLVSPSEINTTGIRKLTVSDNAYAKSMDCSVKLLGDIKIEDDGKVSAIVAPFMVSRSHILSSVSDVYNAVTVNGRSLGNVMFYGQGAGREATASAVVSDICDALKNEGSSIFVNLNEEKAAVKPFEDIENKFFVRIDASEKQKALKAFGEGTTIPECKEIPDEFVFITPKISEGRFAEVSGKLDGIRSYIRVY